jgi:hypothetical protein
MQNAHERFGMLEFTKRAKTIAPRQNRIRVRNGFISLFPLANILIPHHFSGLLTESYVIIALSYSKHLAFNWHLTGARTCLFGWPVGSSR